MNVTIIGTGYVGLVTGVCLASYGHQVTCVDVDPKRVESINRGEIPFYEPGLPELLEKVRYTGRFHIVDNISDAIVDSNISIIAVGTPSMEENVDLSYIESACIELGHVIGKMKDYHIIVVKSTVPPGTTDTFIRYLIDETSGLSAGEYGLCMNPEFLREGSAVDDFINPDRIIIGEYDYRSGQALDALYNSFDCPKIHTSLRNAEMIKYASNSLLAILVSFSNEIAGLCESTEGMDIDLIMDALHLDKRLTPVVDGKKLTPGILSYLRAGIGYGGSCLPKDVDALRAYGRSHSAKTYMLDAAVKVNAERPGKIVAMVEKALGGHLEGKKVGVLGLAFKPGTDDLRASPALLIIEKLVSSGSQVSAFDPVAVSKARQVIDPCVELSENPVDVFCSSDAVVIVTAWPEFTAWDWATLTGKMSSPCLIDGRNVLRNIELPVTLKYWPIGQFR